MKGYKAFKKGLVCKGKQYAENTVFEEPEAIVCEKGMHYCHEPLAVLDYYNLVDSNGDLPEFAEVDPLEEELTDDGTKFCTRKLKIGGKISLAGLIKAQIEYVKEIADSRQGDRATLAGGDEATLAGGDWATLAGGYRATLAGGYGAKLAGGNGVKLAGGNEAKLAGGDEATLAGGYRATLAGGYGAKLAGGNEAKLAGGNEATLAGGDEATLAGGDWAKLAGGYGAILVAGRGSVAKAKKGALIVLAERDKDGNVCDFCAKIVDGDEIKEDVLYKLDNGTLKEVE